MKINGNEIKPGNVLQHQDTLWAVVKVQHVKPGKGGAFAQVEMKNLIDGRKLNERFRSEDKVERVRLEQKDFQYLYTQDDMLIFMDTETYEQLELQADFVGDRAAFLQDGMMVTVELHEERPIGITLPQHVTLEIAEADAVVKGQTQSSSYKPALMENGVRVSWCRRSSPPARRSSSTPVRWNTSAAPTDRLPSSPARTVTDGRAENNGQRWPAQPSSTSWFRPR
jgi:elongation factor P